jgi:lysine-specific demethylase PHF8
MAEESDDETYCLCRRAYTDGDFMIQCDICKDWFHGSCVGVEEHQAGDIDTYHCPNCQPEHGPLTLKRRRNWHRHDYSEINDGKKAVQSGTVVFVDNLKRNKKLCDDEVMVYLHGSQLTTQYFEKHGFSRPIMIKEKDGLGVKVPSPDFRVCDVEKYVGPLREVDVIDVNRQDDLLMKMREWTEYYESTGSRKKILNVISLEFSNTELSELVSPPTVVTQIDWINRHWPDNLPEHSPHSRPQVQKYCLMSVKDSYTDFHVDFGGTSVWYHILRVSR